MANETEDTPVRKFFNDALEAAAVLFRLGPPKPPANLPVEEPEVEDEPKAFGEAFVTMTEGTPDDSSIYHLTLEADKLDQSMAFYVPWDEWSDLHESSPFSVVTTALNKANNADGTDLEVDTVTQFCLQHGEDYAPTMLWVLIMKHDAYYELTDYADLLNKTLKEKLTCRFSDLPDQKALLN